MYKCGGNLMKDFCEFKKFINGKSVAVVGLGVSNIPLINFLVELGANVTGFDMKSEEALGEVAVDFKKKGVKLELGEKYLEKLTGYEVVFKTPSMRIDCEALVRSKKEGAYITSEMEEFVRYCKGKIYAITGSDGKTTTTTIIITNATITSVSLYNSVPCRNKMPPKPHPFRNAA